MRPQSYKTKAWPPVEPPALKGSYVGFWPRLWASFLDTILTIVVTYPFLLVAYGWAYLDSRSLIEGPLDLVLSWMFPAAAIVVFWIYCSATPGKMAIGAKIVDAETGGHPTQWQMIKRYVGYFLSSLPLCWGFLRVAFDSRKQGWHDKFAGTVVVYTKKIQRPHSLPPSRKPLPGQFGYPLESPSLREGISQEEIALGTP